MKLKTMISTNLIVMGTALALLGCSGNAPDFTPGNSGSDYAETTDFNMKKISGFEKGDFYMLETEVDYRKWYDVFKWATSEDRGNNIYVFRNKGTEGSTVDVGSAPKDTYSSYPVTYISWHDSVVWCNALSEKEGLEPVYYVFGTTDFTSDKVMRKSTEKIMDVTVNENANGYKLPTLEQWTYAAKGGNDFIYSGSDNIDEVCWYMDNSKKGTVYMVQKTGTKKSNNYGLKDMSGNVWEWTDTKAESGRLICGGAYTSPADECTVSSSSSRIISYFSTNTGFRVIRKDK